MVSMKEEVLELLEERGSWTYERFYPFLFTVLDTSVQTGIDHLPLLFTISQ